MDRLTTTIKRQYLREIVAGRKTIEFREIRPYWESRLAGVSVPLQEEDGRPFPRLSLP